VSCAADGRVVAYIQRRPDQRVLKIRRLAEGTTSQIPLPAGLAADWVALSPAGDQFAFFARAKVPSTEIQLLVQSSTVGTPRVLARAIPPIEFPLANTLEWSLDGRYVCYPKRVSAGGVPVAGGAEERLGLTGKDLRDLSVSPDGARIAFATGSLNRRELWAVQNVASMK
jgi:hypothetical protein